MLDCHQKLPIRAPIKLQIIYYLTCNLITVLEKVSIPKTGKRIDNLGSQWELKPIYKRSSVNYKSAKSHLSKGKIRCR